MTKIEKKLGSHRGTTLLEVMISIAILALIISSVSTFYGQFFLENTRSQIRDNYLAIGTNVEHKLQSAQNLYWSILYPPNVAFRNCLVGAGSACTPTQTQFNPNRPDFLCHNPFTLVDKTAGASTANQELGWTLYDKNGKPGCKKDDPTCLFEVKTCFFATCPVPSSSASSQNKEGDSRNPPTPPDTPPPFCKYGASDVHVFYQINQIKDLSVGAKAFSGRFAKYPAKPKYLTLNVSKVLGREQNPECGPGSSLVGVDNTGKGLCRCQIPFIQDKLQPFDNQGRPICTELQTPFVCNAPLVYSGVDRDGMPQCTHQNLSYSRKRDDLTKTDDSRKTGARGQRGCLALGSDYYITSFKRECKFVCTVLDPNQNTTVCSNIDGDVNARRNIDGKQISTGEIQGLVCDAGITCDRLRTN